MLDTYHKTMTTISNLPTIKGFTWRGIESTDGPLLQKFEEDCSVVDGATNLQSLDEWGALAKEKEINTRSIVAINAHNEIALTGWYQVDERVESVLAFLEGRVHPDFRGNQYGTALLDWLEKNAGAKMKAVAGDRECTYRIMFYDRAPDAPALFEKKGYMLQYIEQEMERDLKEPEPAFNPQNLSFEPWTEDNKAEFYKVYKEAFRTRTGTPMKAEAWHPHFANPESSDYQPDLSLLARKSDTPVAYTVIHIEEATKGSGSELAWITQTGVHADYRRQGIGATLLTETMKVLQKAGYQKVKLSVHVDNPGAISLYEYLGFSLVNSFTMYYRTVNA